MQPGDCLRGCNTERNPCMKIQNYVLAESLEQAYQLNQNKRNCVLGGMMWLRLSDRQIHTAIDLSGLELDQIQETEEEFSIGAMVTLRQLEKHSGFLAYTNGACREALKDIVGVQFRNSATLGGSLVGRFGFSDVFTFFLALDAYVELYQGGLIPIAAFRDRPIDRDILVRVVVKKRELRVGYQSMRNTKTDFPVLAVCAAKWEDQYHVAVGARPGKAVLLMLPGEIQEPGTYVASHINTQSNMRGSAAYRKQLARVLTDRAIADCDKSSS